MLRVDGLTKRYDGRRVLEDVTTQVAPGSLTYLLGLNGAGKSTLLRCISGIVTPDRGSVTIRGRPGDAEPPVPAQRRELGVHLDIDGFDRRHTGRRHLRWIARSAGIDDHRVDELLDLVGLGAAAADRPIGGFSLGMRQRLGIAGALLGEPPVLLFDEPQAGLDIAGIIWLRHLLRELADEGRTVVVASHLLDEVRRNADRILVLDGGKLIVDQPPNAFLTATGTDDLEQAYLRAVGAAAAEPGSAA